MSKFVPEPEIFLPGQKLPESITSVRAFNDPASSTVVEAEVEARMSKSQKEWEAEDIIHFRTYTQDRTGNETSEEIEKRLLQDIEEISAEMKNPSVITVDEKTEIILPNVSAYYVFKL